MKYFNKSVAYLEDHDFDDQGNLVAKSIPDDIPVVIMLQASWCPHCVSAKPAFQDFADKYQGKVFCATIQADGDRPSEKALGKRIAIIKPGFRGFPDYILYKNKKQQKTQITGRSVEHLKQFAGI